MRRALRRSLSFGSAFTFMVAALGLGMLRCSGSEEDTTVNLVTACDTTKLNDTTPEKTVKLYAETAAELGTRATQLLQRFTDVCNKINRDMGEAEGADVRQACNKIAARLEAAQGRAPVPDGGAAPLWFFVRADETCNVDPTAEATCLDICSGEPPCNAGENCSPPSRAVGKCSGICTGNCQRRGENLACIGECRGACAIPNVDGGVTGCGGECVGTCAMFPWTGRCTTGCSAAFRGECGGTCTGTCDGNPIAPPGFDAGVEGGAPDAGNEAGANDGGSDGGDGGTEAGAPEGGAPDAGGPPPPPTGADGNCKGLCVGRCSSNASGFCAARCTGEFSGGQCNQPNACKGTCKSGSAGCQGTCTGTCVTSDPSGTQSCDGTCRGQCSGDRSDVVCEGTVTCKANAECGRVCRVKGALATKCPLPGASEVRVAGDNVLYTALMTHANEFMAHANEATMLKLAAASLTQRTTGEYAAIGATRDQARKCVELTGPVVDKAIADLNTAAAAGLVVRGTKF